MNEANRSVLLALVAALAIVIAGPHAGHVLHADDAEARRLLQASAERYRTRSIEYTGEVIAIAKGGRERRKSWRVYREGSGGSANHLIRFTAPPEVRGVAFLSRGRAGSPPDQWIYLPSMKRERRISSQDRDAPFAGTDFAFEDLDEVDLERYDVTPRPDETIDGAICDVLRLTNREAGGYATRTVALRRSDLAPVRLESTRAGGAAPAKRLVLGDYRVLAGRSVAMTMTMYDLQKGSRTIVRLADVVFDQPQPVDRFTIQNLTRER